MLKKLSVEEIEEAANNFIEKSDSRAALELALSAIKRGEKVIVKEKLSKSGLSYKIYRYDNELYRYSVVGEVFAVY